MNTNINIEINDYKIIGITEMPNKGVSLYLTTIEDNSAKNNKGLLNLMIINGTLEDDFLRILLKNGIYDESRLKWIGAELKIAFIDYLPIALIVNNNICILENHYKGDLNNAVGYSNREYLDNKLGFNFDDLPTLIRENLPKVLRK